MFLGDNYFDECFFTPLGTSNTLDSRMVLPNGTDHDRL